MKYFLALTLVFGSVNSFAFSEAQCKKHGGEPAMNGTTKYCNGGKLHGYVITNFVTPAPKPVSKPIKLVK